MVFTTRLRPHGIGDKKFKILGATSSGSLSCGIPVAMPVEEYEKIEDRIHNKGSFCASVTGLYRSLPITNEEIALKAAGVDLPQEVLDWLSHSFYVPSYLRSYRVRSRD